MVSSTRSTRMPSIGRSTRNKVAPSSDFAITIPTEAPTMPVMNALRPFTTQWLPSGRAVVCIIDGSEPAPPSAAGSVIRKAERARPDTSGSRNRCRCSGPATRPSRNMLPSSGAATFSASGPSGDNPAARNTIAVARWLRWWPSGKMCGVSTPCSRALARSSAVSASVGPWESRRSSVSYGITTSRTKRSTRCAIACPSARPDSAGTMIKCPSTACSRDGRHPRPAPRRSYTTRRPSKAAATRRPDPPCGRAGAAGCA